MAIEQKFRKFGESAIASYNFTDIAEGTGVVLFYGFGDAASGAYNYSLTGQQIYSFEIESTKTIPTTFTFNTSVFNYPRIAKGTAIVRFSTDSYNASAGSSLYFNIKLQKVSGVVVTDIGNTDTSSTSAASGVHNMGSWTVTIDLTQTNFKIGDNLRLLMTAGGGGDVTLGHDPANRDGAHLVAATHPTKLEIYMPFKIDI